MEIGIIGLGKMGLNLALNAHSAGYDVRGTDLSGDAMQSAQKGGLKTYENVQSLLNDFTDRKLLWIMLPSGKITEKMLDQLLSLLSSGDILIEGGNSNYKDSIRRAKKFEEKGIHYLDCGTSGGTSGARHGACLMIGGNESAFKEVEPLFKSLAIDNGYLYAGPAGSGHFLKMIHNGIEYGMMQAIGEGFQMVEKSDFDFDLASVARVWNHGSVIRGWLMEIIETQFSESPHLSNYKGEVAASGEAKWTVETALEMDIPVPTIALSLFMRNYSQEGDDCFSAKVVSALRNGFGGHAIVEK